MGIVSARRPTEIKCEKAAVGWRAPRLCGWCGVEFTPTNHNQKYCGDSCKKACKSSKRKDPRPSRNTHVCEVCGKEFAESGGNNAFRYCSKKCGGIGRATKNGTAARKFWEWCAPCVDCGVALCGREVQGSGRCRPCHDLKIGIGVAVRDFWRWYRPCANCGKACGTDPTGIGLCKECMLNAKWSLLECVRCGEQFRGKANGSGYCKRCQDRVAKNKGKHRKRCKDNGLPYDSSITLAGIIERDGPVCYLCGEETVVFVGKWEEWSPLMATIDHIVPLNGVGNFTHGHTWDNVKVACAACNTKKSDSMARCLMPANIPARQSQLNF